MKSFNERYLDFCKPFIDGLKDVYKTMLDVEIKNGAPKLKNDGDVLHDYSSVMGISGNYEDENGESINFRGSLVISWPMNSYLKSSSKMLMEEITEYTDDIKDVGMELANITMGNSKKVLNPMGYKIDMSIPNCVFGKEHRIDTDKGAITILLPFESEIGAFLMLINYREGS